MKISKEQKTRLKWFMEFAGLDLKKLSRGERMKWTVEIKEIIGFTNEPWGWNDFLELMQDNLQKKINQLLKGMSNGLFLEYVEPIANTMDLKLIEGDVIRTVFHGASLDITLHFLIALDHVPFSAIHRCKECKRPFITFSKNNKKTFCVNNCASRYGARRRRKKANA